MSSDTVSVLDSLRSGLQHRDLAFTNWHLDSILSVRNTLETRQRILSIITEEVIRTFPFDRCADLRELYKVVQQRGRPPLTVKHLRSMVELVCRAPICPLARQYIACFESYTLELTGKDKVLHEHVEQLIHYGGQVENSTANPTDLGIWSLTSDTPMSFNGLQLYPDDPIHLHIEMTALLNQLRQHQMVAFGNCLSLHERTRPFTEMGHERHGSRDPMLALWDAWVYQQSHLFMQDVLRFWRHVYLMFPDSTIQKTVLTQGLLTIFYAEHLSGEITELEKLEKSLNIQTGLDMLWENGRHNTPVSIPPHPPVLRERPLPTAGRFRNTLISNVYRRVMYLRGDALSILVEPQSHVHPCRSTPYRLLPGWSLIRLTYSASRSFELGLAYRLSTFPSERAYQISKLNLMDLFRSVIGMNRLSGTCVIPDPSTPDRWYWLVPIQSPAQAGTATLGRFDANGRPSGIVHGLMTSVEMRLEYLYQCCFRSIMGCGQSNEPGRLVLSSFVMMDDPDSIRLHSDLEFTLGTRAFTYELAQLLLQDLGSGKFNESFTTLGGVSALSMDEMTQLFQHAGLSNISRDVLEAIQQRSRSIGVMTYQALRAWEPHS
jgi:hypothetical protein